jgi:hypothetical protein
MSASQQTPHLIPNEARTPLVAARRLAAMLAVDGEDLTASERVVLTRALHHNLEQLAHALLELDD